MGREKVSKLIHAAYAKRSALPIRINREVKALQAMLASEAGGSRDLTGMQIVLIDRIAFKFACCRCIERHALKTGLLDEKTGALHSTLNQNYLAWANSLRLDLRELGSSRRPEDLLEDDWSEPDGETAAGKREKVKNGK